MAPAHPHLTLEAVYPALWKSRPVNLALPVRHAFLGIEELLGYKSFSEVIEVISKEKNVITDVTWVSVYEIFSFKDDIEVLLGQESWLCSFNVFKRFYPFWVQPI